jgi:hypothetical protein
MKQYQNFLRKHGNPYREDVVRHNSVITRNKPYEDGHEIFLAEQEMRSRTVGGRTSSDRRVYGRGASTRQSEIREETVLGLGEHKGVSILKKHRHAPIPWDEVVDERGGRRRGGLENSLSNRLGGEGYGASLLLDPIQEKVLFSSTKRDHLLAILESLQVFYVPEDQLETLVLPFQHDEGEGRAGSLSAESSGTWGKVTVSQGISMSSFLPRAYVSWVDQFMQTNVLHLPRESQIQFLKTLLHMYHRRSGGQCGGGRRRTKRTRGRYQEKIYLENIPIVLDIRVERFYSFIKDEYGLSSHIVDKDPEKDVAVISFEITHRYILAIFLDVRPAPFYRAQHRLCKYLLDYLGILDEGAENKAVLREHDQVLDKVLKKVLRERGHSRQEDSGRLMRNMLERRVPTEHGKGRDASARRNRILSLRTTGIVDVVLYACACRRPT